MKAKAHPRYKEFKLWFASRLGDARRLRRDCFRVAGPRHTTATEIVQGVGAYKAGGRWNPVGVMDVVYLSTDPITATAEAVEHFRYYRLPQSQAMPKVIVTVAVDAPAVLDLTDPAVRATMPVRMSDLLVEDWRATMNAGREAMSQAFGRAAFAAKLNGLIVPSKPHRGGVNVLIFPQRLGKAAVLRVVDPDLLANLGKPA